VSFILNTQESLIKSAASLIKCASGIRDVFDFLSNDGAYNRYLEHHKTAHPHLEILTFEEFFKEEQSRRWGGIYRCC
jgi:uncharacterized short protein YbdD (DUF466 family)